jgi:hypothetical protein
MSVEAGRNVGLQIGQILFIDTVGYSKLSSKPQLHDLGEMEVRHGGPTSQPKNDVSMA